MSTKPILFNTDMKSIRFPPPTADEEIRAILANRKTATRRAVKEPYYIDDAEASRVSGLAIHRGTRMTDGMPYPHQPYRPGDILYVREAWTMLLGSYLYRANQRPGMKNPGKWLPSIHMPREAARIFLRVMGVRVEQLYAITGKQARAEGFLTRDAFIRAFLTMYPDCTVKSWVWVIEFERISKEEAENHGY